MSEESVDFLDFKLNKQLWSAIADAGYETPTEIQAKAIPLILAGNDVVGVAQTGTGKTAAYLIPLIMKIKYAKGTDPRALIVVPARELALQVHESIKMLAKYTDLRSVALVGGVGTKSQKDALAEGVDIVVATPGRLMDMYLPGFLKLKLLQVFIMDEAERLLDMGFRLQIGRMLEVMPRKRQNLLFSATWNEKVQQVSEDFLLSPTVIRINPEVKTVKSVSQVVYFTPNGRAGLLHVRRSRRRRQEVGRDPKEPLMSLHVELILKMCHTFLILKCHWFMKIIFTALEEQVVLRRLVIQLRSVLPTTSII